MTERKPKVLMVVLCFLPESIGGAEIYTYHLSQELVRRGYDVVVLAGLQDLSIERYRVVPALFEGLRLIKVVNSFYYARTFEDYFIDESIGRIFRDIVHKEKPDIIHFQHLAYLSGHLPEIASQLNVPSVFTIHDYWYMCFRSQLIRPRLGPCPGPKGGTYCASCLEPIVPNPPPVPKFELLSRLLRSRRVAKLNPKERLPPGVTRRLKAILYKRPATDETTEVPPDEKTINEHVFRYEFFRQQFEFPRFVLSPSYHLKKRYEAEGYREILHVPLGFYETEKVETPPFEGTLRVAYLGNLVPFKGALVILKDLVRLRNRDRVEVHIHGRPANESYFDEVKQFAQQLPKGRVFIHGGYRSDKEMQDLLSKVHLVVFPSLWEENYPLVVREALLHGVPVIGSKLGGVPEAIVDGENGFLFDPYKEGDLAEKLDRLLDNPGILNTITAGARRTSIEPIEDHLQTIRRLYEDALSWQG